MIGNRWWPLASLLVAALALLLLMAGPQDLLGVDSGQAGTALLVTVAWVSLYRVSRLSGETLAAAVSPGEWQAWIGTGFMLAAVLYFAAKLHLFGDGATFRDAQASAVARNLVMLLIAWTVLSRVMESRWRSLVQEDERDRQIQAQASGRGRGALMFGVIALAVTLGLSPPERLEWASHFMIANLLLFALMVGWLVEYAATALRYLRDRR
jgi:uncharacterized membrane protein